ncbi:hypothetical protein HPP05_11350 [Corallococcus exiguus]|uniref:hypothetical protein n=1 Tax=Corallococcus exiguus TaxID=83462 RepID=UPI0014941814|nr:hypothetical protein [Corallococcus exiguus]NPC70342.1 hypothetical protein [Corallococcus exiguus]NRD44398.1 hypothetical protein [Corallococcus exiguus]
MERVQDGGGRSGHEVRSELERAQVELAAARRKVRELEQTLEARSREARKWQARAVKEPRPASEYRIVAFVVGVVLGGVLLQWAVVWGGGRMPPEASSPTHKPAWDSGPPPTFPVP